MVLTLSVLAPFQPAHVAGGTGGTGMSAVGELVGLRVQVHAAPLGVEEHAVLGLVVDLELGVVGPHVALAAGLGQPRQRHRGDVAGMAGRAGADRAVVLVGPADVVALAASLVHGGHALHLGQLVRRAIDGPLVDLLGEGHLLGREVLLARRPPPRPARRAGSRGTACTGRGGSPCSWRPTASW